MAGERADLERARPCPGKTFSPRPLSVFTQGSFDRRSRIPADLSTVFLPSSFKPRHGATAREFERKEGRRHLSSTSDYVFDSETCRGIAAPRRHDSPRFSLPISRASSCRTGVPRRVAYSLSDLPTFNRSRPCRPRAAETPRSHEHVSCRVSVLERAGGAGLAAITAIRRAELFPNYAEP